MQEAPFGVIGFETTTAVVMSLVKEGKLGLVRAVELLTNGPAAVLGLGCGRLEVGGKADLVVFDPNAAYEVDVDAFLSKARNCPFAGWRMEGRAVCTLVGGEVVWQERDFARRLCRE